MMIERGASMGFAFATLEWVDWFNDRRQRRRPGLPEDTRKRIGGALGLQV